MKKILFFLICCAALASCRKNGCMTGPVTKTDSIHTSGVLHYDNFADGWGLYYETDSKEHLIFKNTFSSDSAQYQHFKPYVNLHTRLNYSYHGETGCLYGIGPVCGVRVVEDMSLETE